MRSRAMKRVMLLSTLRMRLSTLHARIRSSPWFLTAQSKSVFAVANTIFPLSIYQRYGAPKFFDVFNDKILRKVKKNNRWSGYYFERMTSLPTRSGKPLNQLWDIVKRIRHFNDHRSYNKYELGIFDAERDFDRSRYGG